MNIPIDAGRSMTISRSRDGTVLIVQREDGTQLIQLDGDAGCQVVLEHSPRSVWCSVLETDATADFWEYPSIEGMVRWHRREMKNS